MLASAHRAACQVLPSPASFLEMAATSLAGRVCAGRDANPPAPLQVSAQRDGLFRPVHLDHRGARVAHPVLTVADASAVRGGVRSGVGCCPAPCRELDRGCRWASSGKELVCVPAHQELQPQGALLPVACHSGPDALRPAVPQAGVGGRAFALAPQQAREQLQAPQASMPRDLAPLWAPLAAQQAREQAQQPESLELFSAQREPPDGLRADAPQVHVLQAHQRRVPQVSREPGWLHAARAAAAPLLPPLLSPRAPPRLLLRRRQSPSSDAGPSPQLRR